MKTRTFKNVFRAVAAPAWAMSLFLVSAVNAPAGAAEPGAADVVQEEIYPYTMNGKVRILFFWVGRDDVGGGNITLVQTPADVDGVSRERIEVLFGSKPERVPGKHNRWGYAFETSYWRALAPGAPPELARTVFEGFMRHSKESSMAEVKASSEAENESYAFKGTRSEVLPARATAEIRYFTTTENFDYRNAAPIRKGYEARLAAGPPDTSKSLVNEDGYGAPYGFLSATRELLRGVVTGFAQDRDRWEKARPSEIYVHNAKRYRLRIKDIDYKQTLRLDSEDSALPPFRDVASVDFRIEKLGTSYKHDFTVSIPLRGELSGIPVRIVDKPRWWLRVELELAPDATLLTKLDRSASEELVSAEGN